MMNHFEEILCEGQSLQRHNFHDNQQNYDKSTNQSNLISTGVQHMHSPFDSSPKASMFFFSLNSPRQNTDNFQFHQSYSHFRKNSKDHIQPIVRRLEFQEDASLFCQQDEVEQQQQSVKQEEQWNFQSSETSSKGKKIKKSKNSKGLKNLSVGVYEIVAEKGHTTYKQVANTLIQKLNQRANESNSQSNHFVSYKKVDKDQHNIKRRVYDALNVLISAELLRKQGKRVICNYNFKKQNNSKDIMFRQHENLTLSLQRQKLVLQQKKRQLEKLLEKKEKIKNLIDRNVRLGTRYPKIIALPFIVVKSKQNDLKTINIGSSDVQMEYQGRVIIQGDIDTIQEIQKPATLVSK